MIIDRADVSSKRDPTLTSLPIRRSYRPVDGTYGPVASNYGPVGDN